MLAVKQPAFSREGLISSSGLNHAVALTPDTVGICSTFVANVALILILDAHDDALLAERNGLKGEAVWNRVAVQLVDAVKVAYAVFALHEMPSSLDLFSSSGPLQCFHAVLIHRSNCNSSISVDSACALKCRDCVRVQRSA